MTTTETTEPSTIDHAEVRQLQKLCVGQVTGKDDREYEAVTTGYNMLVEWTPEIVVRAAGAADVSRTILFAREHGLSVAVKSGGLGTIGAGDGSVLLDLGDLNSIDVQPDTVRVGPAAIWADIDRETGAFGRYGPGAQTSWVGAAGFALGGGYGWMGREHGWASDNIVEVEMIDAEGRPVRINADEEPDLFWGMRGSGWNFGVVTSLTLRTFAVDKLLSGWFFYTTDRLAEVLEFWDSWTDSCPDELSSNCAVLASPPGAPPELTPSLVRIAFCLKGESPEGMKAVEVLQAFGSPLMDTTAEIGYGELQDESTEFLPPGMYQRFRHIYLDSFEQDTIAEVVEAAKDLPPLGMIGISHYGGALGQVGEHDTAMSHRGAKFNFMANVRWWPQEDGQPSLTWQDATLTSVRGDLPDRGYVNYLFDEPERVENTYNPKTFARLQDLKRTWDPDNMFCHNHNVPPAKDNDQ